MNRPFLTRFRSLITDVDGYVSIGRVSYWMVFAIILWHWHQNTEPAPSLMTAFMALLGYEVFKKGRDLVERKLNE